MRSLLSFALLFCVAAPVAAQSAGMASSASNPLMASNRQLYNMVKANIAAAAEQMPEEHYAFRPTPEVRTFGELIGHIANSHYVYCSLLAGEQNPNGEDIEETRTTKAALVEALRQSIEYCDGIHARLTDAQLAEPVRIYGAERNRGFVVVMNIGHDNSHYGNIVTYMRLKGLVPPSSQRSM